MFKVALGGKFKGLKTKLAAYAIDRESIGRHNVESFLKRIGYLTTHSYGNDYENLITIIVDGHIEYHGNCYIPCNKNEFAENMKMSDVAKVFIPALVSNQHFGRCNTVTTSPTKGNAVTLFRMNRENASLPEKLTML